MFRPPPGSPPLPYSAPSRSCPPAATEPLAVVVSAGAAFVTTTASAGSAQAVGPAGLLFGRKGVVEGKRVDLGGRRVIKKKRKSPFPFTALVLVNTTTPQAASQ